MKKHLKMSECLFRENTPIFGLTLPIYNRCMSLLLGAVCARHKFCIKCKMNRKLQTEAFLSGQESLKAFRPPEPAPPVLSTAGRDQLFDLCTWVCCNQEPIPVPALPHVQTEPYISVNASTNQAKPHISLIVAIFL